MGVRRCLDVFLGARSGPWCEGLVDFTVTSNLPERTFVGERGVADGVSPAQARPRQSMAREDGAKCDSRFQRALCVIVILPVIAIFTLVNSMEEEHRSLQRAGTASAALHLFFTYGLVVFSILDNNGIIFHDGIDQAKGRYDLCGAVHAGPASSYPEASMLGDGGSWQVSVDGRVSTFFVWDATVYCKGYCDGTETGDGVVPFVTVNLATAVVLAFIVGCVGQGLAFGIGRTRCGCLANRRKLVVAFSAVMLVLLVTVALGYALTAQSGCQVLASSVYASVFFGWSVVMALTVILLYASLSIRNDLSDKLTASVTDKTAPDGSCKETSEMQRYGGASTLKDTNIKMADDV